MKTFERFSFWGLFLLVPVLFLGLAGCGCGGDDDSSGDDDVADDTADDTAGDDTGSGSPLLDFPPDETIEIPGLSSEARVALDQYAIPYIFAANDEDLMRIVGYMEAQDRMFQMDFLRHYAEGRLTEYIGDVALDTDLYHRVVFMSNDGQSVFDRIEAELDDSLVALIQAYADGINAWLDRKRAAFPDTAWPDEYYFNAIYPDAIPDWEVRDTISIARYQTWDLSSTLEDELELTDYAGGLSADLYEKFFPHKPWTETTVMPPTKSAKPETGDEHRKVLPDGYRGLRRTLDSIRRAKEIDPLSKGEAGSNNWVVSPSINNGIGYLANDPHLDLTYPSIFMIGFMDTRELGDGDVRSWGTIFPGTPLVVIGANDHLAWGETVAGYDVLDVYAEELVLDGAEPSAVHYDGGDVDLIKSTQTFVISGSDTPTEVDVYVVPHHGPILPDSIDIPGEMALSFRWTGQEPTTELKTFFGLSKAQTVDEGFAAVEYFQVGAQNFVLQDVAGDIGYFPNAKVPVREWDLGAVHPWEVLPGDGSSEWNGYIPQEDMPQMKNPERGFILTANNDINGTLQSGDPTAGEYYWYSSRDIGFRAERIEDLLSTLAAADDLDFDSMKTTQLDILSGYAGALLPRVITEIGADTSGLSADAQAFLGYFVDWNYMLDTGLEGSDPDGAASADAVKKSSAVAAMAFAVFELRLREMAFGDEFAAAGVDFPYGWDEIAVALLTQVTTDPEDPVWDNVDTGPVETRRDIFVAALNQAALDIPTLVRPGGTGPVFDGDPVDEWYWGRLHNLMLGHIAFSPFGISVFDKGPYAIPGGLYNVNVAGYDGQDNDYVVTNGPSVRILHEFKDGKVATQLHLPGGEVPIVDDPNELDLLQLYLTGTYYPIPNDVTSILAATQYMYSFVAP